MLAVHMQEHRFPDHFSYIIRTYAEQKPHGRREGAEYSVILLNFFTMNSGTD